jgi:phosphotriesterase-related protein
MVHPGRDRRAPFQIVDILRQAGADLERSIICHIDRTLADTADLRRLAETGCVLEFDLFGYEGSYYAWDLPIDMPNDAGRVNLIRWLIEAGHGAQITLSHDIAFKDKLAKYGGPGYAHILKNAVPLMRRKGIAEAAIRTMLVETPRRLLTVT